MIGREIALYCLSLGPVCRSLGIHFCSLHVNCPLSPSINFRSPLRAGISFGFIRPGVSVEGLSPVVGGAGTVLLELLNKFLMESTELETDDENADVNI